MKNTKSKILQQDKIKTYKDYDIYKIVSTSNFPYNKNKIEIKAQPKDNKDSILALCGHLDTHSEEFLDTYLLEKIIDIIDGKESEYYNDVNGKFCRRVISNNEKS